MVVSILCPKSAEVMWLELQRKSIIPNPINASISSEFIQVLIGCYKQPDNHQTGGQLLSIVADKLKFEEMMSLLPSLTEYEFSMARLHKLKFGRGMREVNESQVPRYRVVPEKLDHFLDFVTSSHVIQDQIVFWRGFRYPKCHPRNGTYTCRATVSSILQGDGVSRSFTKEYTNERHVRSLSGLYSKMSPRP